MGARRAGHWITTVALVSVVLGAAVFVSYAVRTGKTSPPQVEPPSFTRFEAAWSSAMAKAGVEATFPVEPVDITRLRASGRRSFEATFTAEEISALLNVYRFETVIEKARVSIGEADVSFPAAGVAAIDAVLFSGDSGYRMRAEGPLTHANAEMRSKGLSSLNIEGFNVGGSKRVRAGKAVVRYLNELLDEAPGLTVDSAEIIEGAVRVRGWAPVRLEVIAPRTEERESFST